MKNLNRVVCLVAAFFLMASPMGLAKSNVSRDLSSAGITSGTVDGAVIGGTTPAAGTFTDVVGTASVTTAMFKLNGTASVSRPASGATAGSIVAITNSNAADHCGNTTGSAGSVYVVCISNGTDWVVL